MSRLTLTIIDRSYSNLSPFYTLLLRAMPKVSLVTRRQRKPNHQSTYTHHVRLATYNQLQQHEYLSRSLYVSALIIPSFTSEMKTASA